MFDKNEYDVQQEKFLKYLKRDIGYADSTLLVYERYLNRIGLYLELNGLDTGIASLDSYISSTREKKGLSEQEEINIRCTYRHFEDYIEGRKFSHYALEPIIKIELPPEAEILLKDYISYCTNTLQNAEYTYSRKEETIAEFLYSCSRQYEPHNFALSADVIQDSLLTMHDRNNTWPMIRLFLEYCFSKGYTETDFSHLVPRLKRELKIHSSYTEEELLRVQQAIDTSTLKGKRDLAIFLLAYRLGMRIGDIVRLQFDNINFVSHRVNFTAQKTGEDLSLLLLPEIENALHSYIDACSENRDKFVFQTVIAPVTRMSKSAFNFALSKYFRKAEVDTNGKKHGPHSLRASFISSMVRTEIPYEGIKEIVGHSSRNAISHYARIDVNQLRHCVLCPVEFSGAIKKAVENGKV